MPISKFPKLDLESNQTKNNNPLTYSRTIGTEKNSILFEGKSGKGLKNLTLAITALWDREFLSSDSLFQIKLTLESPSQLGCDSGIISVTHKGVLTASTGSTPYPSHNKTLRCLKNHVAIMYKCYPPSYGVSNHGVWVL